MIIPNKIIDFRSSLISKIPIILDAIGDKRISIGDLYRTTYYMIDDVDRFLMLLDIMYIFDLIAVIPESGTLIICSEK